MSKTLDQLSCEYEQVCDNIRGLTAKKSEIESQIIDVIGQKSEGTTTSKSNFYKASTVAKVNRTFDKGFSFKSLANTIGDELASKIARPKYELSLSEYRKLDDETRYKLSDFITTKPAKTAIKIERIEQGEPS